jgi:PAS domain S-box-containing protein
MQVVTNNSYGGLIARRLLLPAMTVPFFVGWLILKGEQAGLYDTAFAISMFALILMIIFSILIWQSAMVIDRLSHQHNLAQKALKMNEEKLQSFVNANIIGILFGDIYGGIDEVNDEFLRIIGYTQEDIAAGRIDWRNLTPPEFLYLDEQAIAQAQASEDGACLPYQKEYIHKNGNRIPVLIGFVLIGEEADKSIAFILDVSEREAALSKLQKTEVKILKLNQKLKRKVTELQTLFDMIPIGIGIAKDPECKTINMNPAFAKFLRMQAHENGSLTAPDEEKPTKFKVFREGKELSDEELPMQYSAAHGVEILDFEVDVVHENGTVVNMLEYVTPLFDEEGKTRGCIGAFLDITGRKQSEKLLRNHQKWLEDILNWMPIPVLFIEPETARVIFANQAADKLAGSEFPKYKTAEEYHTVYHCTDAGGNIIPNQQMPGVRVARGERLAGFEMDWHTPVGIHSLLIFADTLPAMHGHPATCVMTFQDVTELKQIEKDLSLGYKNLQLLFNTANSLLSSQEPVALIDSVFQELAKQIDMDTYFNYVVKGSPQVMQLVSYRGFSEEVAKEIEILEFGQAICGTVAQEQRIIVVDNVQESTDPKTELIRSLGIKAYYGYPLMAQGRLIATLSFGSRSISKFNDNQKAIIQAVCNQVAIGKERANLLTSLQEQTEQLREANRIKDEFLAVLSHELRSPLNAILGWSHLLRIRKFSEDQVTQGLETIERNAKMQNQLIDDLLDISCIIRGKLKFNPHTCNLVPIIYSAIEAVSLAAKAKEINLRFSLDSQQQPEIAAFSSAVIVSGDSDRLQQIIWNLLTNAIKFTPQDGEVEIRLDKIAVSNPDLKNAHHPEIAVTRYAQIQVIDNGIGINSDFLPYVFDRFRQADSSTTRSHGGLGLGLALVRYLVELHGGTVDVKSAGKNQGSTFTVKLPLLEESPNINAQTSNKKDEEGELKSPPTSLESTPNTTLALSPYLPILEGVQVLVVDDNTENREFLTTVFKECRAEVTSVASAQEALQMIIQSKPDILVSDTGIPQHDKAGKRE